MMEHIEPVKEYSLKFMKEFKEFAMRGNVIDLAIGVVIGTAFNGITNSLVKDVIMPPLGLLLNNVDFSNLYFNLSGGTFRTLAEAQAAGAITINYGMLLNQLINFLILALVIFIVVQQMNRLRAQDTSGHKEATKKPCPFCITDIPIKATRCPACTSKL